MAYRSQDSWNSDCDYLTDLGLQIEAKIRDNGKTSYSQNSSNEVSQLIEEYERGINSLKPLVNHRSVSEKEQRKRRNKLEDFTNKLNQFKHSQVLGGNPFDDDEPRSQSHSSGMGPGLGQRLTVDEMREQQKNIIAEQDRGLEQISAALRRQQKMGYAIQDEVSEHNVIIDDISAGTTRADSRIRRETRRIEETRRKEKTYCTCVLWTMIIALAIAIIVIGVIPYKN